MGGGQGKQADGASGGATAMDACDHTPIFSCYDELDPEEAIKAKEQVAGSFVRVMVPDGKSIFSQKIGRRDLLIVEKGELRMVSCHGEKNKKDRPLIKKVLQGEMMGMMELVRNVESDRDEKTGEFPTDVAAVGKAALLVLTQETYLKELVTKKQDKAATLFCENLERLTRASVVDWLRKVVVLQELDDAALEQFAAVAHFRSEFEDQAVVAQDTKVSRLHVVLSGALKVHCHDEKKGEELGEEIVVGHLQSGDFFGESSLLRQDDKDHGFLPLGSTASVTTESECLFIYFEADKMRECLESMPDVATKIDTYIKDRITAQLLAMNLTLFDAMRPAAVALFTSVLEIHTYSPGDVIIKEGDAGDFFYVLINGSVKIDTEKTDVHVALSRKGDYFGEMSLLRPEPRHATVTAAAETTLACIPGESFAQLCLKSPEMAAEFEIKALGTKASVGALLGHPHTAPLLKAQLDAEFSSENYKCWDLIEEFKAQLAKPEYQVDALNVKANDIYQRFIVTDTEELINMSAKALRLLKKHFENVPDTGPPRDLFDQAQKCISNNLRGNLQRFCVTPEYKAALQDFDVYTTKKAKK